jgi:hypothetical protein
LKYDNSSTFDLGLFYSLRNAGFNGQSGYVKLGLL